MPIDPKVHDLVYERTALGVTYFTCKTCKIEMASFRIAGRSLVHTRTELRWRKTRDDAWQDARIPCV